MWGGGEVVMMEHGGCGDRHQGRLGGRGGGLERSSRDIDKSVAHRKDGKNEVGVG